MAFGLTDVLLSFIIFQLLFVSLFLFSLGRGKRISNVLLSAFFLFFALNLLDTLLLLKGVYFTYPAWGLWGANMTLLFGPLLYLHTQSVIYRDFRLTSTHLLHTLPFVLLTGITLFGFHRLSVDDQQRTLQAIITEQLPKAFYIGSVFVIGHFLMYLLLSLRLIRRYKRTLNNQFSAVQNKNLTWLSSTILFFLIVIGLSFVRSVLVYTPFASYQVLVLLGLLLALIWFINRFLLKALRFPELFAGVATDELAQRDNAPAALPDQITTDYTLLLQRLATYMVSQKPYLESELTLDDLAQRLDVRPKVLSAALNDGLGQHFFDYVNRYRVDEAKRLLTNPPDPKVTVLEVMYQVGFNSRSSFNTLFRKYTGQTPSAFKNRRNRTFDLVNGESRTHFIGSTFGNRSKWVD